MKIPFFRLFTNTYYSLFNYYYIHASGCDIVHLVLICISLVPIISNDAEHLFMFKWLLAIYVFSILKCLFKSFAQLLIELLIF